jgi:uncharacterized coiled-coil DUF342 family protein
MADKIEQLHGLMQSTQADQQRSCSEVQDLRAARESLNVELQQLRDQLHMGSGAQQQAMSALQELRSENHNLKQQLQVSSSMYVMLSIARYCAQLHDCVHHRLTAPDGCTNRRRGQQGRQLLWRQQTRARRWRQQRQRSAA